jgi:tRNA(Arg) A34 adenosine deaminase TadA
MSDVPLMLRAIMLAEKASLLGESPFGALVANAAGDVVAEATDEVGADYTQHAEISAVRRASRVAGRELRGFTLYTTVEPCPMCFTAAWLARIDRVVFGCTMAQVHEATRGRQRELQVEARRMNELSGEPMELEGGLLADRCLAPFKEG